jgi:hypothetical protein
VTVTRAVVLAVVATVTTASLGCGADRPADKEGSGSAHTRDGLVRPNYYEDVFPILAENCLSCHTGGGISGRPLDTYETAFASARHVQHAVATREMPPWGVDSTGSCGTWAAPRWLSNDDIATIVTWIDLGAPSGDPRRRAPARVPSPPPADGVVTSTTTRGLAFGHGYTPAPGDAVERCFVLDPELATDVFVTGLSLRRAYGIRQVTLWALDAEAARSARELEGRDGQTGHPCASGRRAGAHFLLGGTWNDVVARVPAGTGLKVSAGTKILAHLEYDLLHSDRGVIRTDIDLETTESALPARWLEIRASPIALEPDSVEATVEARRVFEGSFRLFAVYPQMRRLGRTLRLVLDRPAARGRACLMDQFDWHYNMLRQPRAYASPHDVESGSLFTVRCSYSTKGRRSVVGEGTGPDDEECAVLLYAAD